MGRRSESQCVGCGKPCIRYACPYYDCEVVFCDDCGFDIYSDETIYTWGSLELCRDCYCAREEEEEENDGKKET